VAYASEVTTLWCHTNMFIIIIIIFLAHQHKAAGRKTRLDIQNYDCNGNLLCDHSVVERLRKKLHFLFAEPWKGVGIVNVIIIITIISF